MKANFEEKTYENYFNNELNRRSDIYFPPGQVQEGFLGFDVSSFSRNRRLWCKLGHPFWFRPPFGGVDIIEIAHEMNDYLKMELDSFPNMKANLLFQYKRPEFIKTKSGKEWQYWNRPYCRYDIYKEQQELLMQIDNAFGSRVLIVYAAPTTHDVNELVTIHINRQILDHSNFKKASELDGHCRNTYIKAGTFSIACSEPKKIENFDLHKEIQRLTKNNLRQENSNDGHNRQFVKEYSKGISSIIEKNKYFSESFNKLNLTVSRFENYELLHSFLVMINFRQLTGTQWLVTI